MRLTVFVKPGSKKGPLVEPQEDGSVTVFIQQRAVDGAANEGLIAVLAKHFDVSKSKITIESGFTSRIKRVSVDIWSETTILSLLASPFAQPHRS